MVERLSPRDILEKLVSFPTVSDRTNLPLIEWVEGYFASHGITSHRHYDESGEKAGLFAHVGPKVAGGVLLSGHTDVVPVEGQPWASDPFVLVERDGRLYGRGACDMKGFDALAIWAMVEGQSAALERPLQIALTYDEEIGCEGAPPLIEAMAPVVPKASAVIVGEPSMMQAVSGHKGIVGYEVYLRGFEVHSSLLHQGVSAVMQGAKLIDWANGANAENAAKAPGVVDAMFEPPWTTVHVGTVAGGTAQNITALECRFGIEFRVVPGEDGADWMARFRAEADRLEAEMRAVRPEAQITLEEKAFVPGLKPEEAGAAEALVRRLTGDNGDHVVSYGTEAGHFQNAGYSAVICGPGDIAQAHQPNEFLALSQLQAGQAFMRRLLKELGA